MLGRGFGDFQGVYHAGLFAAEGRPRSDWGNNCLDGQDTYFAIQYLDPNQSPPSAEAIAHFVEPWSTKQWPIINLWFMVEGSWDFV